jgi:hypothetical protein
LGIPGGLVFFLFPFFLTRTYELLFLFLEEELSVFSDFWVVFWRRTAMAFSWSFLFSFIVVGEGGKGSLIRGEFGNGRGDRGEKNGCIHLPLLF